nr:cuticle protein [Pandalus borealis]
EVQRIPLPYLHVVPTETEAKFETKQFKSVAAATPADTTKIELTTQEHVFKVPGFKYVQPVVEVKPVKYTALAPQVFPYQAAHPFPFYPFAFPGLQYQTFVAPYTKEEAAYTK